MWVAGDKQNVREWAGEHGIVEILTVVRGEARDDGIFEGHHPSRAQADGDPPEHDCPLSHGLRSGDIVAAEQGADPGGDADREPKG